MTGCANTHAGARLSPSPSGTSQAEALQEAKEKLIVQSSLDWTIVRPPRLSNAPQPASSSTAMAFGRVSILR